MKLSIEFIDDQFYYARCNIFNWIVDNQPLPIKFGEWGGSPFRHYDRFYNVYTETFDFTFTKDQVHLFSNAKSIDIEFCKDIYRVKDKGISTIHSLLSAKK